jgi:eukaryotic-like serine/threonine-protein kinase
MRHRPRRFAMACLDEETIVAFIGARLPPAGIDQVEAHTGACPTCRELLSLALAAAPAPSIDERASPASDKPTLARGTSFGRYTVLGPLGRGAMGDVYAAYDPELDRKVALKILHARSDGPDGRTRSRLLREAKAIARLRHPNVVVVH